MFLGRAPLTTHFRNAHFIRVTSRLGELPKRLTSHAVDQIGAEGKLRPMPGNVKCRRSGQAHFVLIGLVLAVLAHCPAPLFHRGEVLAGHVAGDVMAVEA